ncbi:MAG: ImmA/IrrE family metallo-endopeptidase [Dehalococcoidia bacterium]|nr:ImmA/IrrE family metallo-endopeptidase [Dehalococcoidia bacterium]MYF78660.1 ImmA/IrrE family metallo-endopeptidase [Chloroflexota bacterium]
MNNRRAIARQAMAAALRTRLSAGYRLDRPVCVYDLAERLGVEVRFLDLPSMEGMYSSASGPTIIVSSLRPRGRRAFTCAHELGHHNRKDGVEIDELVEQWENPSFDPKEFMADCFAGALLMPKMAVSRAFAVRGWNMEQCTPEQALMVSGYFGVGYTTLVHHMRSALQVLPYSQASELLRVSPRKAQSLLLGWHTPQSVLVVDTHWCGRAIDVEVGDFIFFQGRAQTEGLCLEPSSGLHCGRLFQAVRPGIGRLEADIGWSAFVRVSRRDYVGRALYRHWEEA